MDERLQSVIDLNIKFVEYMLSVNDVDPEKDPHEASMKIATFLHIVEGDIRREFNL